MLNLVLNACEATETPGATAPETGPRVTLSVRRHRDDHVIIEVTDTGPGPSPDVCDTLFEPLVTTKPDGTGLGLAVARTIVEEHNGTLAFSREEGKTIFTVELPLLKAE